MLRHTVFQEGPGEAVRIRETPRRQDRFEPVPDALMERQPGWALHGAPQKDMACQIARAADLDPERAEGDRLFPGITGIPNEEAADLKAFAIRQTPTVFLNGKRLENLSAESLVADLRFAVGNA